MPEIEEGMGWLRTTNGVGWSSLADWWHCDEDYGRQVAGGVGIDLEEAKALPPLEGRPAPGQNRQGSTYTSGKSEASEPSATTSTSTS